MKFDNYPVVHTEFVPRPDLTGIDLSPPLKQAHIQSLLFNSYNTLLRVETLLKNIKIGLINTPVSLKYISGVIESIIIKLLTSSTITDRKATYLTPHYIKFSELPLRKDVPYDLSKVITYGYSYIWGGMYGTPLYYNYLSRNIEHYQNPANLAHIVYSYFFKKLRQNFIDDIYTPKLTQLVDTLFLNGINNNEEIGDTLIYNFHKDFLTSFPFYTSLLKCINSLTTLYQHLDYVWEDFPYTKLSKEFYFHLVNYGVQSINKPNNLLPHSEVSYSTEKGISVSGGMLEAIRYGGDPELYSVIASHQIDTYKPLSYISIFSNTLLNKIPGPGGYNEILTMLSLILLVRAFSLCHVENIGNKGLIPFSKLNRYDWFGINNSNPLSDSNLGNIEDHITSKKEIEEIFYRVNKLIFFSGLLLRKSNLFELNILGNNICTISGYKDNGSVRLDINT